VDHHGNTSVEPYLPQGFGFIWERPRDLRYALNWAIAERAVDASRISAVGYSLGGYSVAALAGARLNPAIVGGVLSGAIPVPPLPEYPNLVEDLSAAYSPDQLAAALAGAGADLRDPRVGRIVMLAPAVGQLVDPGSLAQVGVAALVMWGADDVVAAPAENAVAYAEGIPGAVGVELGAYGHGIFRSDVGEPANGPAVRAAVAQRVVGLLAAD
jgi:predicted dienelactone hydrolase